MWRKRLKSWWILWMWGRSKHTVNNNTNFCHGHWYYFYHQYFIFISIYFTPFKSTISDFCTNLTTNCIAFQFCYLLSFLKIFKQCTFLLFLFCYFYSAESHLLEFECIWIFVMPYTQVKHIWKINTYFFKIVHNILEVFFRKIWLVYINRCRLKIN